MRILIVDDEPSFALSLTERLRLRGMEVSTALDAPEALAIMEQTPHDLIFLDVGLPGMDGVALLKVLREQYPQSDVVMLSGAADMDKAVQAMRRGAVNWLSKPMQLEDVLDECRKAEDRRLARQEAARLAETARWRSLGRVAEGVAHEVNNPLNIIVQAAGLVRDCLKEVPMESLPDADDVFSAMRTITVQCLRVREITKKLLILGQGLDNRIRPLDVAFELEQVLVLLHERMEKAGVRLEMCIDSVGKALGSGAELRQICLHLLENALDAMPHGGVLRLTGHIRQDSHGQRDWYELCVHDSGTGISVADMPHIFEPFFSTRALQPSGAGPEGQRYAGLGLAVARSLASARNGELTAANAEDGGAVFCLQLPLAEVC
ncbi:MAG: sensor histidine kinase [Desulfobulbus sp.]|jgi:two-component system NtrC family sensor kinase